MPTHLQRTVLGTAAVLTLALSACAAKPAGPVPTTLLPADGGDLAKAWSDLAAAMKAADKAKASALLSSQWHLDNKDASWFGMFADLGQNKPVGGKRQGDRATLFFGADQTPTHADYRHVSATWTGSGWRFDAPLVVGSSFDSTDAIDCKAMPTLFPCSAKTAPDAIVSGTLAVAERDMFTGKAAAPVALIDGVATRLFGAQDNTPLGTQFVLSTNGINPAGLAWSSGLDHVRGWIGQPVVTVLIAPDGKSAKLELDNGGKHADLTQGLTVEQSDATRVRGRIKADVPDFAALDVYFDIPTASRCHQGSYLCGAYEEIEKPKAP